MWHEARKQERMIRGLIVDYRRRAERRKDFYEKIKAEPTQFLQIHGRPCKIHLEPAVAAAGDSPAIMMPWQGDTSNLIDRFDVRAHLDYIPDARHANVLPEELAAEERQCNYERYRILAQNAFLGIGEEKFLRQLAIEEQFGVTIEEKEAQKERQSERKGTGVAIGFNYNDPGAQPSSSTGPLVSQPTLEDEDSDDDSDLEIIDMDLSIDVNKMEPSQAHELNAVGPLFGMAGCDLFSYLTGDADDAEHQKQLLIEEKEKAMFSGRKSRRERRAHRCKKVPTRLESPPAYAAATATETPPLPSRSPSPSSSPQAESIQFITSFGGEDDRKSPAPPKPLYAEKLKMNLKLPMNYSEAVKKPKPRSRSCSVEKPNHQVRVFSSSYSGSPTPRQSPSPKRPVTTSSPSRSPSPITRSMSSKSRSRSFSPKRKHSRSRSRSYSPRKRSRMRSRSGSGGYKKRSCSRSRSRSQSRSNHANTYAKRAGGGDYRAEERRDSPKNPSAAQPPGRYYGRRKGHNESSSESSADSDSSDDDITDSRKVSQSKGHSHSNRLRSGHSSKGERRETMTFKEKLKKKMQAQLAKQLRADKQAEAEREERESRRQARRDEEMRELAIKLRRKQREIRHLNRSSGDSDDDDAGSRSRSHSHSSISEGSIKDEKESKPAHKSKSRSPSPKERRIPVWTTTKAPDIHAGYINNEANSSHQPDQPRRYFTPSDNRYKPSNYPECSTAAFDDRRKNFGSGASYTDRKEEGYNGGYNGGYRREGEHSRPPYRGPPRRFNHDHQQEWPSRKNNEGQSSGAHAKSKVKLVDY